MSSTEQTELNYCGRIPTETALKACLFSVVIKMSKFKIETASIACYLILNPCLIHQEGSLYIYIARVQTYL